MRKLICLLLIPLALVVSACAKPPAAVESVESATAEESGAKAASVGYMDKLNLKSIVVEETACPAPVTLPDGLPSYGYCAVGEVDETAKKVAILGENGVVTTRVYDGAAPTPGYIYAYETEDEYIAFTGISMFPGFGSQYKGWVFGSYASQQSIYYGSAYSCTDSSVFFVRYSETEWRIFRGANALKSDSTITGGYLYAPDGETIAFMFICGDCGEFGKIPAASAAQTKIFDPAGKGWDSSNITVKIAD
jgi:hypothetical protein